MCTILMNKMNICDAIEKAIQISRTNEDFKYNPYEIEISYYSLKKAINDRFSYSKKFLERLVEKMDHS